MDQKEFRKSRAARAQGTQERRIYGLSSVELRANEDGESESLRFEGEASVYEQEYEVFGGPPWGWIESVDAGAGKKTLSEKPDVVFLANHGGLPMARTKSGTLELSEVKKALRAVAPALEPNDPDVQNIRYKMGRGDLDEMSFAFRVVRQEWNEDYTRRWIKEYDINRGDVSIVTFGANPATGAVLRAQDILRTLNSLDPEELMAEARGESADTIRAAYELLGTILNPQTTEPAPTVSRARSDYLYLTA